MNFETEAVDSDFNLNVNYNIHVQPVDFDI